MEVSIGWDSSGQFEHTQRVARMLTETTLVPDNFRGKENLGNAVIALNMATRLGADVLAVMQSIYIVYGKPSWASTFIIALINSSKRFDGILRYRMSGSGNERTCVAWVKSRDGEILESPESSIQMAIAEGWYGKNGSKWKTMPDLMLRYRAATFFGRFYCPDLMLGMRSTEEVIDIESENVTPKAEPKAASMFVSSAEVQKLPETTSAPAVQVVDKQTVAMVPHPREAVAQKFNAAGLTFRQLKEWNAAQQIPMDGLSDIEDFGFLGRSQAASILRIADTVIDSIKGVTV